jgi:hypothetical protein
MERVQARCYDFKADTTLGSLVDKIEGQLDQGSVRRSAFAPTAKKGTLEERLHAVRQFASQLASTHEEMIDEYYESAKGKAGLRDKRTVAFDRFQESL